jgi:adenylosuccinate synthase
VCSGKSALASKLQAQFGAYIVKTKDVLLKNAIPSSDRLALQDEGDRLDRETGGRWVLDALSEMVRATPENAIIIIDAVRTINQINEIRKAYSPVTHLHLKVPPEEIIKRYNALHHEGPSYEKIRENLTEQKIELLADSADVVLDTRNCTKTDVLERAAGRISLYGKNHTGYVDVIVGGQYGSEGKGQIAGYLAKEYDLLVRVGGPNAGHKVFEEPEPYTHHPLPSGTRKSNAQLLLGPGMVINVENLLKEISECEVDVDRLSIDPKAMIISDDDIASEKGLKEGIGSTAQGVGAATARKIMGRKDKALELAKHVDGFKPLKLAIDCAELKHYIRPAIDVLTKTFARNGRVLLEGTQGTGLSIHHGSYPYVTSRDTTVAGCLSEAGIPPSLVRKVVMVCRTFPIRVESPKSGTSGPMSCEISWEEISRRSGESVDRLINREKTSTTHRNRRVGEFDWEALRKASFINGATDIALTFADYLSPANKLARRFELLTKETIVMIEEIEHVSKARVTLIGTGFDSRSIIDRREW